MTVKVSIFHTWTLFLVHWDVRVGNMEAPMSPQLSLSVLLECPILIFICGLLISLMFSKNFVVFISRARENMHLDRKKVLLKAHLRLKYAFRSLETC